MLAKSWSDDPRLRVIRVIRALCIDDFAIIAINGDLVFQVIRTSQNGFKMVMTAGSFRRVDDFGPQSYSQGIDRTVYESAIAMMVERIDPQPSDDLTVTHVMPMIGARL